MSKSSIDDLFDPTPKRLMGIHRKMYLSIRCKLLKDTSETVSSRVKSEHFLQQIAVHAAYRANTK